MVMTWGWFMIVLTTLTKLTKTLEIMVGRWDLVCWKCHQLFLWTTINNGDAIQKAAGCCCCCFPFFSGYTKLLLPNKLAILMLHELDTGHPWSNCYFGDFFSIIGLDTDCLTNSVRRVSTSTWMLVRSESPVQNRVYHGLSYLYIRELHHGYYPHTNTAK